MPGLSLACPEANIGGRKRMGPFQCPNGAPVAQERPAGQEVAGLEGFEPPTPGLEVQRSDSAELQARNNWRTGRGSNPQPTT